MAPLGGSPPTGGWWCEYQRFSIQLTGVAAPWSRNHSAAREKMDDPLAGLLSARPKETENGMSTATATTSAPRLTHRRRRRWAGERAGLGSSAGITGVAGSCVPDRRVTGVEDRSFGGARRMARANPCTCLTLACGPATGVPTDRRVARRGERETWRPAGRPPVVAGRHRAVNPSPPVVEEPPRPGSPGGGRTARPRGDVRPQRGRPGHLLGGRLGAVPAQRRRRHRGRSAPPPQAPPAGAVGAGERGDGPVGRLGARGRRPGVGVAIGWVATLRGDGAVPRDQRRLQPVGEEPGRRRAGLGRGRVRPAGHRRWSRDQPSPVGLVPGRHLVQCPVHCHRTALGEYTPSFLQSTLTLTATAAVTTYCLWAFDHSGTGLGSPHAGHDTIWIQLTVVPFALAVLHVLRVLDAGGGEAPEDLAVHDQWLQGFGAVWVVLFLVGIYA